MRAFLILLLTTNLFVLNAQDPWYTSGDFRPLERIEFTLTNPLDIDRVNCPIVISRVNFPKPDINEMWVTVVDPNLPPSDEPSAEVMKLYGGHQLLKENNGHAIFSQLDDLDKDGIWDELFFITDMKARETKKIYIYIGMNIRGWNKHYTHANIGSYCRHQVPFWESENVGWKLWFATSCDVYAKRKPVLMSDQLYMNNYDGYMVTAFNPDWGSDIQGVAGSFGGGAMCLFEHPQYPDSVSTPRYTPANPKENQKNHFNAGQLSDTRYAHEVIVNGPVRSMIKLKIMNWNSGNGFYELEQIFSVYAHQSYSTCKVNFSKFNPLKQGVVMGCGIRKKPKENHFVQENGIVISSGPEGIKDPENIDNRKEFMIDFVGSAVVVKDQYKPVYQFVKALDGNHAFKVTPDKNNSFEYMFFSAWKEGAVLNNPADFTSYVKTTAKEYNNPVISNFVKISTRTLTEEEKKSKKESH